MKEGWVLKKFLQWRIFSILFANLIDLSRNFPEFSVFLLQISWPSALTLLQIIVDKCIMAVRHFLSGNISILELKKFLKISCFSLLHSLLITWLWLFSHLSEQWIRWECNLRVWINWLCLATFFSHC